MDEFRLNKLLPVRFVACIFQPVFERSTVIHKCYCSVANNVHNVFAVEQFQMFCYRPFDRHALPAYEPFIVDP